MLSDVNNKPHLLWSKGTVEKFNTSNELISSDNGKAFSLSPTLQNLSTPLKDRILGQKELASLIERVKDGIFQRIE